MARVMIFIHALLKLIEIEYGEVRVRLREAAPSSGSAHED
jgi:hypothetical protein